ncbi:hypothetical protein PQX77_011510 [Marasmius sp. AFHP31]|nr:hypothetical protein PQX77_011510 [Marasmius sp. AFHP31]
MAHLTIPSKADGNTAKEGGKDKLSKFKIIASLRPSKYSHQPEPPKIQCTPLWAPVSSHSEHKEEEGEQEEELDAYQFLTTLWVPESNVNLRFNCQRDIVVRLPKARTPLTPLKNSPQKEKKSRTLLKKKRRAKREGELNSHSSPAQPASNPHSISDPSDDVPFTPRSMGTPALESPPLFNKNYPPSSFVSSSRPDSPISRPPSAVSSATTAPSYSAGSYQRVRSDTLASTQTYETLPSYRSRRNTQIFVDSDMPLPTTPRTKFRPLPPLPSVPSFVS